MSSGLLILDSLLYSLYKQLLSACSGPGTVLAHLCSNKVPILENMHPRWSMIREEAKLQDTEVLIAQGSRAWLWEPEAWIPSPFPLTSWDLVQVT